MEAALALVNPKQRQVEAKSTNSLADLLDRESGVGYVDISDYRTPRIKNNTVISLFTGAGGMEIGLEKAGFQTKVCVEIDADCRATLAANRPDWNLMEHMPAGEVGDVRKVTGKQLLMAAGLRKGEVGLVTGGAPCQPFSNIGKKRGKLDPKNGDLFLEFVRIVRETEPEGFIFENVAGIAQGKHAEVVDYMSEQFKGLGYSFAFQILNAADYGVPQTRKRFIMLGLKSGKPSFPLPTHVKDDTTWNKFTNRLDKLPKLQPGKWRTVGEAFSALPPSVTQRPDCLRMNHSPEMVLRMSKVKPGNNFKSLPKEMLPNCWTSGKHQGHDTFGRMLANMPGPTMRTGGYNPTKGRYIHPFEDRGLSTMEMAAIQSFPIDWRFACANKAPTLVSVGRQIGNAVPPLFAEALGKALSLQMRR